MGLALRKEQAKKTTNDNKIRYDPVIPRRILPTNDYLNFCIFGKARQKKQTSYKVHEYRGVMRDLQGQVDTYVSQFFYKSNNRRSSNLACMSHFFCDFDFYKDDNEGIAYRNLGLNGIALRQFCSDNLIPQPTAIIDSGNGGYAYWCFTSLVPEQARKRFMLAMKALTARFEEWGADTAVTDFARVLRVPGTINSKTGRVCQVIYSDGPVHDFSALCDELLPTPYHVIKQKRDEFKQINEDRKREKRAREKEQAKAQIVYLNRVKSQAIDGEKPSNLKGHGSWCKKGLYDLKTLGFLRYSGLVREGACDLFCHIAGVLLAQISRPENLLANLIRWAEDVVDPGYIQKFLAEHSSTLIANTERDYREKKSHKGYTYRTKNIIEILGITPAEMRHMGVLIDSDERLRRKRDKRHTEGNLERPNSTGKTREEWREEIKKDAVKYEKPWEKIGISRSKYYEMKKSEKMAVNCD